MPRRNFKNSKSSGTSMQSLPLGECAKKYMTAIADPWNPEAEGACIPTFPSRPSQKVAVFARVTAAIGTSGFGFITVMPTLASDAPAAYVSTNLYAGTTVNTNTATTGVNAVFNNSPYPSASFNETGSGGASSVAGRIVSCGVSSEYTGTVLNMGGLYYSLVDPNHESQDTFGTNNLANQRECKIERITGNKVWLCASSQNATEVAYPDDWAPLSANVETIRSLYPYSRGQRSASVANVGAPIMTIMFTGTAGNTFEIEIVQHTEFVGLSAAAMLTPTHSDARGFEIVAMASANLQQRSISSPKSSLFSLIKKEVVDIARGLGPAAVYTGVGMVTKSPTAAAIAAHFASQVMGKPKSLGALAGPLLAMGMANRGKKSVQSSKKKR